MSYDFWIFKRLYIGIRFNPNGSKLKRISFGYSNKKEMTVYNFSNGLFCNYYKEYIWLDCDK